MSQKIKPRQQRKPRSQVVVDMILNTKGGPMRDRRERRPNNPRKGWQVDQENSNGI